MDKGEWLKGERDPALWIKWPACGGLTPAAGTVVALVYGFGQWLCEFIQFL